MCPRASLLGPAWGLLSHARARTRLALPKTSRYEERLDNRAFAPLEFVVAPNFSAGVGILLQTTGLGAVRPNTLLMGYKEDWKLQQAPPH